MASAAPNSRPAAMSSPQRPPELGSTLLNKTVGLPEASMDRFTTTLGQSEDGLLHRPGLGINGPFVAGFQLTSSHLRQLPALPQFPATISVVRQWLVDVQNAGGQAALAAQPLHRHS